MKELAHSLTQLDAMNPTEPSSEAETTSQLTEIQWDPRSLAASAPFVGQWNQLVSQTNWEKGRIISEWRCALMDSGSPNTAYSDEAWAQCVGAVTSQHVGRLRRVHERFAQHHLSYPGLYWSHFLAAIEWDDAELWLEGAVRSSWSVSEMRRTRSEASIAAGKEPERDEELISSEIDDGFVALASEEEDAEGRFEGDGASGPIAEGPDFGDEDTHSEDDPSRIQSADPEMASGDPFAEDVSVERVNPFANLGELPPDVAEAMEQFKLAIIRHRSASWTDIPQSKMVQAIEALLAFTRSS
jgi:hypothetical protein